MAKMSLKDKLQALATLTYRFTSITPSKDQDGNYVAILKLEEPIAEVRGTQEIEWNSQRFPVVATDVTEVKVHESNMNDDFVVNEDGTVDYKGDKLILDVAKSTKQVWMVGESFATSGNKMRVNNRNERLAKIIGKDAANPAANAAPDAAPTKKTVEPTVVNTNTTANTGAGNGQPAKVS